MNDETKKLPALVSGGAVRAIVPNDFDSAWRIANAVVVAGMAPKEIKTPEAATVVILHGLEVGLTPMAALQSIALINGRPSIWGDGALGLVQASGLMETFREALEGQGENRMAVCTVKRRGDPELKIGRFSIADAKRARLWGKQGPWTEYPERMLQMRARSWALRNGFSDVLRGLAIAEEQRDITLTATPIPPQPPTKTPPTPPKPPAKKAKEPEPEPPAPEPEIIDAETGEVQMPGDLLSALDDALATAADLNQIEEIWNDHDVEAALEQVPQGHEFQTVALGIKRRHMKRFE